jgi:hypothetical protein
MGKILNYLIISIAIIFSFNGCHVDEPITTQTLPHQTFTRNYKANKVVVIVIDGARYSETYGDTTQINMPEIWGLTKEATLCSHIYNDGTTFTMNGMSAIATGVYNSIPNNGTENPIVESIWQRYIERYGDNTKAMIISSKDKLEALANCSNIYYKNKYMPKTDCGNNGLGSGYRNDSITLVSALQLLEINKPNLTLITFQEPDAGGHSGVWDNYIKGLKTTSNYTKQLVDFFNTNPYYKDSTLILITNDHGRHNIPTLDFSSHGDGCEGCRHISLLAIGPDVEKNKIYTNKCSQIDITATIADVLKIPNAIKDARPLLEVVHPK